uniref:Uncharacterized protein n=1 Tax=Chelonoidis abingdonii TaxID=106734 RepID=A0A8C0JA84_CHEAB
MGVGTPWWSQSYSRGGSTRKPALPPGWGRRLGHRRGSGMQALGGTYLKQLPETVACPPSSFYMEVWPGGSGRCPVHRHRPCSSHSSQPMGAVGGGAWSGGSMQSPLAA